MSSIVFEDNGTEYTLEFDRRSIEIAERTLNISMTDILNGKLTQFPYLFQAAFIKHHPKIKSHVVERFFNELSDKEELFAALTEMYAEQVTTLLDEPDEGKAKSWKRA